MMQLTVLPWEIMETYLIWLAAGFVLVIAELVTGTFFLLVLGIAAFAGSATAWFGLGFWVEALSAAIVAVAGVFWVRRQRKAMQQPDMASLDVGQVVAFDAWISREQGVARVKYRNTQWDAEIEGERELDHGQVLFIHAVQGNTLKVATTKP
ncbi:MAG: NfeD family protein [Betaproteobacteria bacterium]|nr:NfeD family protein [Betaproteobacteria bacterium]